jgi:hypothetical protein
MGWHLPALQVTWEAISAAHAGGQHASLRASGLGSNQCGTRGGPLHPIMLVGRMVLGLP